MSSAYGEMDRAAFPAFCKSGGFDIPKNSHVEIKTKSGGIILGLCLENPSESRKRDQITLYHGKSQSSNHPDSHNFSFENMTIQVGQIQECMQNYLNYKPAHVIYHFFT